MWRSAPLRNLNLTLQRVVFKTRISKWRNGTTGKSQCGIRMSMRVNPHNYWAGQWYLRLTSAPFRHFATSPPSKHRRRSFFFFCIFRGYRLPLLTQGRHVSTVIRFIRETSWNLSHDWYVTVKETFNADSFIILKLHRNCTHKCNEILIGQVFNRFERDRIARVAY